MKFTSNACGSRYQIDRETITTTDSQRLYNHLLVGKDSQTNLTVGDRPAAIVWNSKRIKIEREGRYLQHIKFGEIIFGFQFEDKTVYLQDLPRIKTVYRPNYVTYFIRYRRIGLELAFMPSAVGHGCIVHYEITSPHSAPFKFIWKFGGTKTTCGHIGAGWEGDTYYPPYSPSPKRVNTIYATKEENAAEVQNHLFSMHSLLFPEVKAMGGGKGFALTVAEEDSHRFVLGQKAILPGKKAEGYLLLTWEMDAPGMFERTAGRIRKIAREFTDSRNAWESVAQRLQVQTPDERLNIAAHWVNNGIQANWSPPAFSHDPHSYNDYFLLWRGYYAVILSCLFEPLKSSLLYHGRLRDDESSWPAKEGDWVYGYFIDGKRPRGRIYACEAPNDWVTPPNFGHYDVNHLWLAFIYKYYCWSGDKKFIQDLWPIMKQVYWWMKEARDIDDDGLHVNVLNTWISDSHEYHQGKCTQQSAYFYECSRRMAELAGIAGEDPEPFTAQAEKTRNAMIEKLWIKEKGIFAEYIDALGIRHDSPELASIYLPIECGVATPEMAWQIIKYARDNYDTSGKVLRGNLWFPPGRCFNQELPSETVNTVLAIYRLSQNDYAYRLLTTFIDSQFENYPEKNNYMPLTFPSDCGDFFFMDDMGLFVRTVVEGLFGLFPRFQESSVVIAPNFPTGWKKASIKNAQVEYHFKETKGTIELEVTTSQPTRKIVRLPLSNRTIISVTCNGRTVDFKPEEGIDQCFAVIDSNECTLKSAFRIRYQPSVYAINAPGKAKPGKTYKVTFRNCLPKMVQDPQGIFSQVTIEGKNIKGAIHDSAAPGKHTFFVQIALNDIQTLRKPVEIEVPPIGVVPRIVVAKQKTRGPNKLIDLGDYCNEKFAKLIDLTPPELAYGFGLARRRQQMADHDGQIRFPCLMGKISDGIFTTDLNIPFKVTVQDNELKVILLKAENPDYLFCQSYLVKAFPEFYAARYPSSTVIELNPTRAHRMHILFAGAVSHMQSYVENVRVEVLHYGKVLRDLSLSNPKTFDYFLYHTTSHGFQKISDYREEERYIKGTYVQPHMDILSIPLEGMAIDQVKCVVKSLDTSIAIAGITIEEAINL